MLTLISTICSFLAGGLPKLLDFLQDRNDKRQELELARMQIERELQLRKLGFDAQAKLEEIRSVQIEMETANQQIQARIGAQVEETKSIYVHAPVNGSGIYAPVSGPR